MNNKLITHMVYGYPNVQASQEILDTLQKYSKYVEVQFPFSDPIADGRTIQHANQVALEQDITPETFFDFLRENSEKNKVIIMTYLNIVYQYGFKEFLEKARESHSYGLIVPDLPFDTPDFQELHKHSIAQDVNIILTTAARTPEERIQKIAEKSRGFIYALSQDMTTGGRSDFGDEYEKYIQRVKNNSSLPVGVGFGIRNKSDIDTVLKSADYAIIGTELIRQYDQNGIEGLDKFLKEITEG